MADNKISLALVITELDVGGAERAFTELACRLDKNRYEVRVYVLGSQPPDDRDGLVRQLTDCGIQPEFFCATRSWQFPWVLAKLWRRLRKQRPQIVQAFLFHANVLAMVAGKLAGVRNIVTGIRVAEPRRWHLRVSKWLRGWAARHVCVSQSVADYMHTNAALPTEALVVIPNGVDLSRFASVQPADLTQLGVPAERRAIAFVGRLDPQKGLGWLMHLAAQMFTRFERHDLLVVGHGPAREMLERMVAELGLSRWVRFIGWRSDVPAILAASDALILPSQWEGMPNVVLEAMAAGKPIVACQVEGVLEILGPLAESQTVPVGDAAAFVAKLAQIVEDPIHAGRLGAANRQRVVQSFSIDHMALQYDLLYTSLVAGDLAS